MLGITSSRAALAMSATALFVALGGTALAVSQIGTNQIKNGAVTTSKLHNKAVTNAKLGPNSVGNGKIANNAVTNGKIAANAVTGSKVQDGSLTSADVAPNTFLASNGTAADSARLGGLLPADFVQGVGFMQQRRIVVNGNTSGAIFLNTLIGAFTATCTAGNEPQVTWTPTTTGQNYAADVQVGTASQLHTLNNVNPAAGDPEPVPAGDVHGHLPDRLHVRRTGPRRHRVDHREGRGRDLHLHRPGALHGLSRRATT